MNLPKIGRLTTSRIITESFKGYDHRLRIQDGAFYDMENMSGDHFPLLANRKKRGSGDTLTKPGGLIEKDALCYAANGKLYVNGNEAQGITLSTDPEKTEKQLVSMGAYIVIFPDKKYYNTEDSSDYGSLDASWDTTADVSYAPCDVNGVVYELGENPTEEPANPENGQIWIDTGEDGQVFQQWSSAQGSWVVIETVYTKVTFQTTGQIPALFEAYDGVNISGLRDDELNGDKILYALGGRAGAGDDQGEADWIVVVGLIDGTYTQENPNIKIERKAPEMDFVCECQNRLWGCRYGFDGENTVNEIYASALGDFKNWRQYLGLSTDSWTASVGSDGQWTGAVNYLGNPCFFKENRIHRVSVSSSGAHRLDEIVCRGVQKGSGKSLSVVGETLYYKSRTDVCAWQGGFPQSVSEQLGETKYYNAASGAFGAKYYLSMQDEDNNWNLFVFDTKKGIWAREDKLQAMCFARVDDSLWCIDALTGTLWDLQGAAGTPENGVSWMAESGVQYYETTDRKYLSRFDFKLKLEQGGELGVWVEYDSSGEWIPAGEIEGRGLETVVLPIRPRRCDHMRMRIKGNGELRLFSVTRILRKGSDRG